MRTFSIRARSSMFCLLVVLAASDPCGAQGIFGRYEVATRAFVDGVEEQALHIFNVAYGAGVQSDFCEVTVTTLHFNGCTGSAEGAYVISAPVHYSSPGTLVCNVTKVAGLEQVSISGKGHSHLMISMSNDEPNGVKVGRFSATSVRSLDGLIGGSTVRYVPYVDASGRVQVRPPCGGLVLGAATAR